MSTREKAFMLYHQPDFVLIEAESVLREQGLTVTREEKMLIVQWGDGPVLVVEHFQGSNVQRQIARLASGSQYTAAASTFDALFQITFDEFDYVLDEINTLIEVQATLQNATSGFLYTTWGGQLSAPEM